ncbi:hypothetical protein Tsp_12900 [Trichinella spiralis]|uniref:hypothetical protein n=1 Tax=Trichinella spiralis TaxID=6334 RepID=UPI0001EFD5FE|nr:hypothetical protein Tsp_12900 [Trichinella spiralis]
MLLYRVPAPASSRMIYQCDIICILVMPKKLKTVLVRGCEPHSEGFCLASPIFPSYKGEFEAEYKAIDNTLQNIHDGQYHDHTRSFGDPVMLNARACSMHDLLVYGTIL